MRDFDYFRRQPGEFRPKSPAAALRGIGSEQLPPQAFIYAGTSIKPLDEEPYDLDAIERVLAREDLDMSTSLLLVRIFEKMVKRDDAEIALLAAEGINQIENRYNHGIEKLKAEMDSSQDPEKQSAVSTKLAHSYYEFAHLYPETSSIRSFYLKESFRCLPPPAESSMDDLSIRIKVLIDLKLYDQAGQILKDHGDPEDIRSLLLEAEIGYHQRDFTRVFQICTWCLQREEQLTADEKNAISYWLGY